MKKLSIKQPCILFRFGYAVSKVDEQNKDKNTENPEEKKAEWKQRGRGDIKFLKHKITQKIRLLMRQSSTYKLILNHYIEPTCQLKPNDGSANAWAWWGIDNSDNEEVKSLFIGKFTDPAKFKKEYDDARTHMEKLLLAPAASTTSTTTAGSTTQPVVPAASSKGSS